MSPTGVYEHKPRLTPKACDVEPCERMARTQGAELCEMHYYRRYRTGSTADPIYRGRKPRILKGLRKGETHPAWAGDHPSYSGAHMRVRAQRGNAKDHQCSCGKPAAQWAYRHDDPKELQSRWGAYSADTERYEPMCVPCHKRFDLARIREAS